MLCITLSIESISNYCDNEHPVNLPSPYEQKIRAHRLFAEAITTANYCKRGKCVGPQISGSGFALAVASLAAPVVVVVDVV